MSNVSKYIFILILGVLVSSLFYWRFLSAPAPFTSESVFFHINRGQNAGEIADNLQKKGLIRSRRLFAFTADLRDSDRKIKAGRYALRPDMNLFSVLKELENPSQKEAGVTIPEGFSAREIDERLTELGFISGGEFASKTGDLEGYLFPDTYFVFTQNFDPQDLIDKMQKNFLKKITPDLMEAIKKQKRTLSEVITMASILEKEIRTKEDYALVAGILWKRLDRDWPLQADATLLYGKSKTSIAQKDLNEDSPYNTRKYKGLPKTPISNPGILTIQAAVYPQDSPYWFYLTDKEGNVRYAKTNEEHNENRRKFLSP